MTTHTHLHLEQRQIDTILAALRFWQRKGNGGPGSGLEMEIATEHGLAMDDTDIDVLCENINTDARPGGVHPLDQIHEILDGKEWGADHLDDIADVLREHGYTIRDPDYEGSEAGPDDDDDEPVCQVCGEPGRETEECCGSDDLPEPGDIRETGK